MPRIQNLVPWIGRMQSVERCRWHLGFEYSVRSFFVLKPYVLIATLAVTLNRSPLGKQEPSPGLKAAEWSGLSQCNPGRITPRHLYRKIWYRIVQQSLDKYTHSVQDIPRYRVSRSARSVSLACLQLRVERFVVSFSRDGFSFCFGSADWHLLLVAQLLPASV